MKKTGCMFVVVIWIFIACSALAAENQPPVADAGAAQEVNEGTTVTLNGSESSAPDDGIASYEWLQTSGAEVTLSNPGSVQPTFVPDVGIEGESFTFQLTVTDHGGLKVSDTCTVNVLWVNAPPEADAGDDQTAAEGITVTLDGSDSSDDDDGIATFHWCRLPDRK